MSLRYTLLVSGSPYSTQAHHSALGFLDALLKKGHKVQCVFFYADGVLAANELTSPANDEPNVHAHWKTLASTYDVPLHACISVANKRGLLNEEDAKLHEQSCHNVNEPFKISGLGEWAQAISTCDRVVHFR